jgi:methyl-accepting chemotaxis protein
VRTLAQRSAAAAKEIKELITASVSKVTAGTALVDEAGATMEQIVSSVRKVHDIMAEITEAGQRQSEGIEQIGRAIDDMDQTTQQNAALVEEASAAAESLSDQTVQLSNALAVFKLETASAPASAPAASPAGQRLALR